MKVDAQLNLVDAVLKEQLVGTAFVAWHLKGVFVASLNLFPVDAELAHLLKGAIFSLDVDLLSLGRAVLAEVQQIVQAFLHRVRLVHSILVNRHVNTLCQETLLNKGASRDGLDERLEQAV